MKTFMTKEKIEAMDVRDEISNYLRDHGIMRKWLAKKLNLSSSHMTLILQKERDLSEDNRKAINEALKTNF